MKKTSFVVENEKGTALVIALLVMTVMTVIGLAATNTSTVEVLVSGNQKIYLQNFYRAEGAAIECAESIETESPAVLRSRGRPWLNAASDLSNENDVKDEGNWTSTHASEALDSQNLYLAVDRGIATGASLDMTGSRLHEFGLFGRSVQNDGQVVIQLGYRRRF